MTRGRVVVLLFAALLFFWDLGGHDLWAPDEPYFAEGAREMVVDGKWAVPHVNGKITTDKPPLFFWLIAIFSIPLGTVTELTARLPSALAAIGTIALTMRMAARAYGERIGTLAGLILATTYLFWEKARWSQTDAVLCFLIWVALSALVAHRSSPEGSAGRATGVIFWAAAALAVLDKGPVGLLLPVGIALVLLAIERDLRRWRTFAPFLGPIVFAGIIGAWMIFATVGSGGEYSVWGALKEHFIMRGVRGMHHEQPFWYFGEVLPPNLMPWTGLLPGALVLAWRRRGPADRFGLVVVLFVIIFFSISTEKRELYALPAVPAVAMLTAALVGHFVARGRDGDLEPRMSTRWFTLGHGFTCGLMLAIGLVVPFLAPHHHEVPPGLMVEAILLGALLALAGGAGLYLVRARRYIGAVIAPATGFAVLYLIIVTVVYPEFEDRKSGRPLAQRVVELTEGTEAPVLAYRIDNVPRLIAFYSPGLYTLETADPEVLRSHLARPDEAWVVMDGKYLGDIPQDLRERIVIAHDTRLARQPILILSNGRRDGVDRP